MADEGFIMKSDDDECEFKVETVEVKSGYVCHIGVVEGSFKVGDEVSLRFDGNRRKLMMNNHTGTHILNFALRQVLSAEADQRGSLVAPDKLRFDFTSKGAMTAVQVKEVEKISQDMVSRKDPVYAKEASLAVAKSIQGLRAVFGEAYPDPVRVVSVGIPVEDLEKDPHSPAGTKTSIEFCGGTHLLNSGHIGKFVISTEESIAKGIRRVVALTGPEADKAISKGDLLEKKVSELKSRTASENLSYKSWVKLITELLDDINGAQIQYWRKEDLRKELDAIKKTLSDADKAKKVKASKEAVEFVKKLCTENSDAPYFVIELDAFAQNKVLNNALKEVKKGPATLFISGDEDTAKIMAMASVPKETVEAKGLAADQWLKSLEATLNGKAGGRAENGQLSGTNVNALKKALEIAEAFAIEKLGCAKANLKLPVLAEAGVKEAAKPAQEKKSNRAAKKASKDTNAKKEAVNGPKTENKAKNVDAKDSLVLKHTKKGLGQLPVLAAKMAGAKVTFSEQDAGAVTLSSPCGALLVTGAVAAAFSLSSEDLLRTPPLQRAMVLSWVLRAQNDLMPLVLSKNKDCVKALRARLTCLDATLRDATFLCCERLTLADVAVAVLVDQVVSSADQGMVAFVKSLKCVQRWHSTVMARAAAV